MDIQNKKPGDFSKFEGDFTLRVLVRDEMLAHDCKDRPSAKDILRHPALWTSTETLDFFHQTSNILQDKKKLQMCSIENNASNVLRGNSWKSHLTSHVKNHLFPPPGMKTVNWSYKRKSVLSLIRALRNMYEHFHTQPKAVTSDLGSPPDSFLKYWTDKFPELLMHTYTCMKVHSSESNMVRFYK
jgi:serine/threonine-protein kinase/endoribonuclease IRE1